MMPVLVGCGEELVYGGLIVCAGLDTGGYGTFLAPLVPAMG